MENFHTRPAGSIFVFGSNLAGYHGAGAAKWALEHEGAVRYVGEGCSGDSYVIPTKDHYLRILPLDSIQKYVHEFIQHARFLPDKKFYVRRIGCGLAGYTDAAIAPLFAGAPGNCYLPEGWREMHVH